MLNSSVPFNVLFKPKKTNLFFFRTLFLICVYFLNYHVFFFPLFSRVISSRRPKFVFNNAFSQLDSRMMGISVYTHTHIRIYIPIYKYILRGDMFGRHCH